jgi:DNA invertase Pin-like site-specific DNA recombinase
MDLHEDPAKVRRAYSYIRFSTTIQEKGDSLRRQSTAAEEFCEQFNLELVRGYQDLGVSAFRGKHAQAGGLKAFLNACEDGRVEHGSVLIVENLDRLSRQEILDATTLFLQLINYVDIGVAQYPFKLYTKDKLNEDKFALFEIQMTFIRANEESAAKSMRLKKAWENKKANAKNRIMTAACPKWLKLDKDRKSFIEIPHRVAIIKEIFDSVINQNLGTYTIVRRLNERSEPTWGRSKHWQISYIKKILSNKAACGVYTPHEKEKKTGKRVRCGEEVADYYPRIVSEKTYLLAQQTLKRRGRLGRTVKRTGMPHQLFGGGLLIDGYTGCTMHYLNKGKWQYIVPSWCKSGKVSYYMAWDYPSFEGQLLEILFDKTEMKHAVSAKSTDTEIADETRKSLLVIQTKIDNLADAIADTGYVEVLQLKLKKLVEQKKAVEETYRKISTRLAANDYSEQFNELVEKALMGHVIDEKNWDDVADKAGIFLTSEETIRRLQKTIRESNESRAKFDALLRESILAEAEEVPF